MVKKHTDKQILLSSNTEVCLCFIIDGMDYKYYIR